MVRFFFGITLKAQYLPWVLCLFNMIVKGGGMIELIGIFVGHIYYFLKFRYAQDFGGDEWLKTPAVSLFSIFKLRLLNLEKESDFWDRNFYFELENNISKVPKS